MRKVVIPSLIAKSQDELDERFNKVKNIAPIFQLDIMDGRFVPNTSLDFDFKLPKDNYFEAHLMINEPEIWLKRNYEKVKTIIVHQECCNEIENIIDLVKVKHNCRIGVALNPETSIKVVEDYLDKLDQVLIMTVNPGFYGSKFLPEMLEKVKELRRLRPELDIEVDGGMNSETIIKADEVGANLFVSGSYLMNAENVKAAYDFVMNEIGGDLI